MRKVVLKISRVSATELAAAVAVVNFADIVVLAFSDICVAVVDRANVHGFARILTAATQLPPMSTTPDGVSGATE